MKNNKILDEPIIPARWARSWMAVFGILMLFIIGYIFFNSLQSREESAKQSAVIIDHLKPLVGVEDGEMSSWFGQLIRKLAHIFEFALLGFCTGAFLLGLHALDGRWYVGFGLFFGLFIGVADEFLQNFTGRGSLVTDVLIDFAGVLLGMLPVTVWATWVCCIRIRKNKMGK